MRRQNTSVLQVEGSRIQRSTVEDQKSGISSFFIFNLINFEFVGFQGRWIMTLQSMYNNATIIFFMSFTSLVESPSTCCGWATSVNGYHILQMREKINMELYLCRSIPSLTLGKVRSGQVTSEREINIHIMLLTF